MLKTPRCIPFLSVMLSLTACHLIDQRDFDAHAGEKPVPHVAAVPPSPPVPALVTISYATPNPDFTHALTEAVHKALAIKPDALFTVATQVPAAQNPDSQADAAALAAASGREVAQAIVAAGAQPAQVEQLVNVDASVAVREVVVRVQ